MGVIPQHIGNGPRKGKTPAGRDVMVHMKGARWDDQSLEVSYKLWHLEVQGVGDLEHVHITRVIVPLLATRIVPGPEVMIMQEEVKALADFDSQAEQHPDAEQYRANGCI